MSRFWSLKEKNAKLGDWMQVEGARSGDCGERSFSSEHGELKMSRRQWLKVTKKQVSVDTRGAGRQEIEPSAEVPSAEELTRDRE